MNLFIRNLFDNLISHLFLLKIERKEPLVEKHVGIEHMQIVQKKISITSFVVLNYIVTIADSNAI